MQTLSIPLPGKEYDIIIDRGLLDSAGKYCRTACPRARRFAVITDSNVAPLYANRLQRSFSERFDVKVITIPAGESSKCIDMLGYLYEELMDFGITRTDAVVALGGGVVGDLAGFAAATILRGIDFIQIPTTLLAQVDSSVGGKVAIDLKHGKNLAGAFHQPRMVLMDPDCLKTLPDRTFCDGMAEVIKYGCIKNREFFDFLSCCGGRQGIMDNIEKVLQTCCAIKAEIVLEDELDNGVRMLLNFGHTLGHAYELAGNYEKWTHGQAVAAGMCRAAEIGAKLGKTPSEVQEKIESLLRMYDLPTEISCSAECYHKAVGLDKKSSGNRITLILLNELGEAIPVSMEKARALELIEEFAK